METSPGASNAAQPAAGAPAAVPAGMPDGPQAILAAAAAAPVLPAVFPDASQDVAAELAAMTNEPLLASQRELPGALPAAAAAAAFPVQGGLAAAAAAVATVASQAAAEAAAAAQQPKPAAASQPAPAPAPAAGPALASRRSSRNVNRLNIYDEDLLYELHNEMLGLGGGKGKGGSKAGESVQPSSRRTKSGGEDEADADSRPAKRARPATASKKSGAGSGDESEAVLASGGQVEEEPAALDPNAETAWAVGLNATGLADEEEGLLPEGADEAAYARVRNLLLARWRSNVSRFLTEKQALASLPIKDRPYGLAAYHFLHTLGFINFGVAPDITDQMSSCPDNKGTVVVVGAGCAGLGAARQLRMLGYKVVVVEGRSRPGGRVYTKRMEGQGVSAVADLGGSIITGIDGNPLATIVKQMGVNMLDIRTETPLFMKDGSEADKRLDQLIEDHHNFLLDECSRMRDEMPETAQDLSLGETLEALWRQHLPSLKLQGEGEEQMARRLFDWHIANLEFANASLVPTLSLKFWDQDDPNELLGAHTFVPGGNSRWVARLCEGLPIFYNSPVGEIAYSSGGVAVRAGGREFRADAAVVTVPLGVLKRGKVVFTPPLTERKRATIERLGFGVLNKVILLFPYAFWSEKIDMFGRVSDDAESRGEAFLFYSYANISGGALLIGLVAGKAALAYEQLPPGEAAQRVMAVLRSIYEPRGVTVPAPIEVVCTQWGSDPMCHGAYSSMAVGTAGGQDYEILSENLGGRVYFAGEATTNKYPATMHGAFYTGLQAAANVDATLRKAAHDSHAAVQAAAAQQQQQGVGGVDGKGAAAASRSPPQQGKASSSEESGAEEEEEEEEEASEGEREALEAAMKALQVVQEQAAQLQQLFERPDLEFGCFAVVHGPPGGALAGLSLLRMDLGAAKGGPRRSMPIYLAVDTQLALTLADTPGDESRVALLSALPEVRLLGRAGLSPKAQALLAALTGRSGGAAAAAAAAPAVQQEHHLRPNGHAGEGGAGGVMAPAEATGASPRAHEGGGASFVIPRLGSGGHHASAVQPRQQPQQRQGGQHHVGQRQHHHQQANYHTQHDARKQRQQQQQQQGRTFFWG